VHLSPSEERLLAILSHPRRTRPISTYELAERMYDNKPPEHARLFVGQLVRSLVKKTSIKSNGLPRVMRSGRKGPFPMEVWVER